MRKANASAMAARVATVVLLLVVLPKNTAYAAHSFVRAVTQPEVHDWPPSYLHGMGGVEVEVRIPRQRWSLGGYYLNSYDADVPGPLVTTPGFKWYSLVNRAAWLRYSLSDVDGFSAVVGAAQFPHASLIVPDSAGSSISRTTYQEFDTGCLLGIAYRASLGPCWIQLAPNLVITDNAVARLRPGLNLVELGLALGAVQASFDPLLQRLEFGVAF